MHHIEGKGAEESAYHAKHNARARAWRSPKDRPGTPMLCYHDVAYWGEQVPVGITTAEITDNRISGAIPRSFAPSGAVSVPQERCTSRSHRRSNVLSSALPYPWLPSPPNPSFREASSKLSVCRNTDSIWWSLVDAIPHIVGES